MHRMEYLDREDGTPEPRVFLEELLNVHKVLTPSQVWSSKDQTIPNRKRRFVHRRRRSHITIKNEALSEVFALNMARKTSIATKKHPLLLISFKAR